MEVEAVTTAPETTQPYPKKERGPLAKHWAGCTLNNYTDLDIARFAVLIQPLADYYVFGKEVGASGTPHLQFMICFKTAKRLTALKKIFPTAHWEMKVPQSTMLRSSNYCKKGDQTKAEWDLHHEDGPLFGLNANFTEFGILPLDQKTAGLKVIRDNYEDTIAKAKAGNIEEINAEHQLKYYGTIKKIESDTKNKIRVENDVWKRISEGGNPDHLPHKWYYGPTGTGKTFRACNYLGNKVYYDKLLNKWWEDYEDEEFVLVDDIGPDCIGAQHIKRWTDKKQFRGERKYSSVFIRPKRIAFTSNYHPKEIWPRAADWEAICDRVQVIHLTQPWNATVNDTLIREVIEPIVIDDAWEVGTTVKKAVAKKPALKKRRFDQPKVAKKPFTSKDGKIVPNTVTQLDLDKMIVSEPIPMDDFVNDPLNKTMEITPFGLPTAEDLAKEKEVINVMDEEDCYDPSTMFTEKCDNCDKFIHICDCYEDDTQDLNYNGSYDSPYDYDNDEEISEDLLDI